MTEPTYPRNDCPRCGAPMLGVHYHETETGTGTDDYETAISKAAEIGRDHGENAAEWWIQDSDPRGYPLVLAMLEDGDPEIMDQLPAADLSGEWADGYTPRQLAEDADWIAWDDHYTHDERADAVTDLCDAYENAFSEAVENAVVSACRRVLAED